MININNLMKEINDLTILFDTNLSSLKSIKETSATQQESISLPNFDNIDVMTNTV